MFTRARQTDAKYVESFVIIHEKLTGVCQLQCVETLFAVWMHWTRFQRMFVVACRQEIRRCYSFPAIRHLFIVQRRLIE